MVFLEFYFFQENLTIHDNLIMISSSKMNNSDQTPKFNRIVYFDILIFVVVILLIGLFNYDYVMLLVLLLIYPYLKLTGRVRFFIAFGTAIFLSTI